MIGQTLSGFRLSPQQKRLWLLQQESSAYLTQCTILIEGNLQAEVLKAAIQQIVNRHEILRTSFCCLSGVKVPVMVVADRSSPLWQDIDLSAGNEREQSNNLEVLFQKARHQDWNLEEDPVLRLWLLKLSAKKHILLVSLPALCADTYTIKNLVTEISKSYSACLQDKELCDEVVQYLQFSEWQNQLLADEDAKAAREYWQEQKLSTLAALKLPFERHSLKQSIFKIDCFELVLASDMVERVATLAQKYNTSPSTFLLSCWQTLIWRLTGQSDIVIGTACDRREYEELQNVLGLLATWIPIKSYLTPDLTFQEVIKITAQTLENSQEWQDYFVTEPVESNNLLAFPIGFEFEKMPDKKIVDGVSFFLNKLYSSIEPFKLKLACTWYVNSLKVEFYYDVRNFSVNSIQRLAGYFQTLLENAIENSQAIISQLEILKPRDYKQLLVDFNQTYIDYPQHQCIHELFEKQVERTPNNIAVVFEDQQLTYAELNRKANQLAHYLQTLGVKPEVLVGLHVDRSLEMIIGLLGILKAGGAYLPLDPALPKDNLTLRLQDAQASLVISHSSLVKNFEQITHDKGQMTVIRVDADWKVIAQNSDKNPSSAVKSENLIYVMFTSGSTGKPKGVAIEHRQLLNYLYGIADRLNLPAATNFATVSTLAADLGNTVIFASLCRGGCLHIISSKRAANSLALAEYCHKHPIGCLKIVPSHLTALLASAPSNSQSILPNQVLILGGEVVRWDLIEQIQQFAPQCRIVNHYGPTETTVGVLTYAVKNEQTSLGSQTVPLGRPIANTQVYVLDGQLRPVPIGVPGEVYISGNGLARGYWNRPELTAERFVTNPFKSQERLYKTGDLARYLEDGNIEFFGRTDNQVKIRGFRIELGEIEAVLSQHPGVQQTVVSVQDEENNKRLVAYVVPNREQILSVGDLRNFLKQKLGEYMVPSAFVLLKALPLTPNGKVNRYALPAPDNVRPELEATYVAPRTEVEQTIAHLWQQILHLEKVGVNDNFFDLGGHSLLLVQMHAKLRELFHANLAITVLFEYPTISSLAKYLTQQEDSETSFLKEIKERAQNRRVSRLARTEFR